LFIVLTLTGVLLMFYYHPEQSAGLPRCAVTSNTTFLSANWLRNMHRWAAHLMVIAVELQHVPRVSYRLL